MKDHPRMCGKDSELDEINIKIRGSPPLAREGQMLTVSLCALIGITPACAGRTMKLVYNAVKTQDHPRVCGKDSSYIEKRMRRVGSPPRVREGLQNTVRLFK